jgi:LysR family hydrogen peroxide-inducible transcriptional activator
VSVAHFPAPQPRRTIGMVWRKSSPLARQLTRIAEVVAASAASLRARHGQPDGPRLGLPCLSAP